MSAHAEAPARTHTVRIGALEVTAIQETESRHTVALLQGVDPAEAARLLGGEKVLTSVNVFLIRMGSRLVLVDTGGSPAVNPSMGNVPAHLKALGIAPESIDVVLLTHLHADHFAGLLAPGGVRAFPKAVVRLPQAEFDYWTAPATEAALPEGARPRIAMLRAALAPYQAAGVLKPFKPGEEPYPGVKGLPSPGHTPGHTGYAFGSGKEVFWAVGDIVHFAKIQFPRPEVTVTFDTDGPKAAESRKLLLQQAAKAGAVIGGAHLPFPALGRVEARGQAFAWLPY